MYDTVGMRLFVEEGRGIYPMEDVPPLLDRLTGCSHLQGGEYVSGMLGGLHITVRPHSVGVSKGSLCKWHLGDNLRALDRKAAQEAIEHLSDILHLPMDEADITRLDFGTNLIMRHPVPVYLEHLGELRHWKRCDAAEAGSLYYWGNGKVINIYDKNRERASAGEPILELYVGRNVLRYEIRYTKRLPRQLNRPCVTAADLYDRTFFDDMLQRWRDTYRAIQKINDITPDFSMITRKSDLNRLGVLALVEKYGGQQKFIGHIKTACATGVLTKKQAHDLRQAVNDACRLRPGLTTTSDAIEELDGKIRAAVKMY